MSEHTAPVVSAASVPAASASVPVSARGRWAGIAPRTVQVALALFFAFASALPKLIAHASAAETFDDMGWGSAGMYAIGVLELAGAIGLLVPVLQSAAATGLSALMVGAFVVQIVVFDGQYAVTPLLLMVPLVLIARARREHNADLLRLVRRRG
ncbi:DoxX family protein [Streptomyces prasinus]